MMELKKGICPKCGEKTKNVRHESDHGLCGGVDIFWTEDCPSCGMYDCEHGRKWREKELKKWERKKNYKIFFYHNRTYFTEI